MHHAQNNTPIKPAPNTLMALTRMIKGNKMDERTHSQKFIITLHFITRGEPNNGVASHIWVYGWHKEERTPMLCSQLYTLHNNNGVCWRQMECCSYCEFPSETLAQIELNIKLWLLVSQFTSQQHRRRLMKYFGGIGRNN